MDEALKEVILKKEGQTYVFRFDAASRPALLGVLGRFAADAKLNFSWHDAAVVCKKVRGQSLPKAQAGALPASPDRLC